MRQLIWLAGILVVAMIVCDGRKEDLSPFENKGYYQLMADLETDRVVKWSAWLAAKWACIGGIAVVAFAQATGFWISN